MVKPGLSRAVPMALIGFIISAFFVVVLRDLQSVEPVWDVGVVLVLAPFISTFMFIWGMGGFDPRMSEHGTHGEPEDIVQAMVPVDDAHDDHHHEEEDAAPTSILSGLMWTVTSLASITIIILFTFAMLSGSFLQIANESEANTLAIETNQEFLLPLGIDTFEASQLTVFVGFIAFTMVSLFAVAGVLAAIFYFSHRDIKRVKETEPTPASVRPPAPVRWIGRILGSMARGLRRGLPFFFGYRN